MLLESGVLVRPGGNGNLLRFAQEYAFDSPSAAAAVVSGTGLNGRAAWKVKGVGISYKEWQEKQVKAEGQRGKFGELGRELARAPAAWAGHLDEATRDNLERDVSGAALDDRRRLAGEHPGQRDRGGSPAPTVLVVELQRLAGKQANRDRKRSDVHTLSSAADVVRLRGKAPLPPSRAQESSRTGRIARPGALFRSGGRA